MLHDRCNEIIILLKWFVERHFVPKFISRPIADPVFTVQILGSRETLKRSDLIKRSLEVW